MKWISTSLSRLFGISETAEPFESGNNQKRIRIKVTFTAALIAGIAVVMISIVSSAVMSSTTEVVIPQDLQATPEAEELANTTVLTDVLVHVVGEVNNPGMFELTRDSRVIDAVMAAGGLSPSASDCGINLARRVNDGEQIKIPSQQEGCNTQAAESGSGPLSLNQATAEQFDSLPGIGPTLAERIIQWRESNGGFTAIEQLNDVSGIGDKLYAGLKDLVAL